MQYRRVRGALTISALAISALAMSLVASRASANISPCVRAGTGGLVCMPGLACSDDAQCFGAGLGHCVMDASASNGVCASNCNAIFGCRIVDDCPAFGSLIAMCLPSAISGVPGICEYRDPGGRPFASVCTTGGTLATSSAVNACFGPGGSWATGDCDGDGVPNGVDANPCSRTSTTLIAPAPSPFCTRGRICEGVTNVCAPLLHCMNGDECVGVATRVMARSIWECSPMLASGTEILCHPSCNATAHCTSSEGCGPLGTCTPAVGAPPMCLPSALATCESGCTANPLDWASAQGDCDRDGAQNGCDPNPCVPGDPPCVANHMCAFDAGVPDAGTIVIEVGTFDAASSDTGTSISEGGRTMDAERTSDASAEPDAGVANNFDGGGAAVDAGPPELGANLGFGGGGGCRCAAAGTRGSSRLAMLAIACLGLVAARRRR